jgi:tRNA threonylcarbamoyladenosine biosynthesis protein TsaE
MTPFATLRCNSPEATRKVAGSIAPLLRAGDVVLLDGDLGAGKTTFAQGLAAALGVTDNVTSPTFTLIHSYPTDAGYELHHVDVYRLERLSEIVDLGLPELLDDDGVAVVEWGRRAAGALPPEYLQVQLAMTDVDDERVLELDSRGDGWELRRPAVLAAVT